MFSEFAMKDVEALTKEELLESIMLFEQWFIKKYSQVYSDCLDEKLKRARGGVKNTENKGKNKYSFVDPNTQELWEVWLVGHVNYKFFQESFGTALSERSDALMSNHNLRQRCLDWSLAPPNTYAWAKDEDGKCHWYIGGSARAYASTGKWLCEAWVRREPAPDFNFDCKWDWTLTISPVDSEGEMSQSPQNETDYLLSNEANKAHLLKSISELRGEGQ